MGVRSSSSSNARTFANNTSAALRSTAMERDVYAAGGSNTTGVLSLVLSEGACTANANSFCIAVSIGDALLATSVAANASGVAGSGHGRAPFLRSASLPELSSPVQRTYTVTILSLSNCATAPAQVAH